MEVPTWYFEIAYDFHMNGHHFKSKTEIRVTAKESELKDHANGTVNKLNSFYGEGSHKFTRYRRVKSKIWYTP